MSYIRTDISKKDIYQLGYDEGFLEGIANRGDDKIAGWGIISETKEYFCTNCKQRVTFPIAGNYPMLYPRCPYCGARNKRITQLIRNGETITLQWR